MAIVLVYGCSYRKNNRFVRNVIILMRPISAIHQIPRETFGKCFHFDYFLVNEKRDCRMYATDSSNYRCNQNPHCGPSRYFLLRYRRHGKQFSAKVTLIILLDRGVTKSSWFKFATQNFEITCKN